MDYVLEIVSPSVSVFGGEVTFRILDQENNPVLTQNPDQLGKFVLFDQAKFKGGFQTFKNTDGFKAGYSETDTYQIPFKGLDVDPNIDISDGDTLTLQVTINNQLLEAEIPLER